MNSESLHLLLKECGQKTIEHSGVIGKALEIDNFVPPADLKEWLDTISQYQVDDNFEFLPGWCICPFERSIEVYEIVKEMNTAGSKYQELLKRMFGDENDYFEKYWNNFILLTDYSDGGCGIGSSNTDYGGLIIVHEIHAPWQIGFKNIDKLIETAWACKKSGVWSNDGDINWDLYYELGSSINPECGHWLGNL
jgi:hypothetical protein